MNKAYVHGYDPRESLRLQDQAVTLVDLLHGDTFYPPGSLVLEAGCGVGAQTITLAQHSPGAEITSVDVSEESLENAKRNVEAAGLKNVRFKQADIFALPFGPESFDHVFVCFVLEHLVDGFIKKTFTAMIEGVRATAIASGIIEPATFDAGIRALDRTAEADGVFCYTFFKAVGMKAGRAEPDGNR